MFLTLIKWKVADDVTHSHARVQAGIRILEDELQVAAQPADFVVFQTRKIDAFVAQHFVTRKVRVARVLRPHRVELLAHVADLAREIGQLFVDLREIRAQFGFLVLEPADIPAFLFAFLDVKERVVSIVTLLNVSFGRIIPVIMTNGV